ncbi:MAG TPA: glycosyltransferase family 2 protein, partial [Acidimicrobiales bacterium]|nr:glycosyltransferase family 2 protein [Acidimicrobiales bacterium]
RNGGIARATNSALTLAEGDFVGFLDDDDLLEPHTLFLYMAVVQADPAVDVLYCDEDVLLPSGERAFPFLKPGWSPETLLGMNYITHFVVARRSLVEEVGRLRPERDGAQDHDLLLRLTERTDQIRHVPEVLYSWRQSPTSTSMTAEAKPWAYEAGAKAVEDALERRGTPGWVEPGAFPGAFRVRYRITEPRPEVTILIPTRDRADLLGPCLESIKATTGYRSYSIVVLDNDSKEPATEELLRRAGVRVVPAPGPFNYAAIVNRGFAATDTELVLTLNNDTRVVDPQWLEALVELMMAPSAGVVGCRLTFADGRLQHEGIALGCGVPAANLSFESPGLRVIGGTIRTTREVSAVTGACSLIRRAAFEAVGGYDEALAVAYNDVDFCLRARRKGWRVLFTPYVQLVHEESSSRGELHPEQDDARMLRRWAAEISAGDPFFSPRLTIGPHGLILDTEERTYRGKEVVDALLRRDDSAV